MPRSSLPNYLRTHRRRAGLSQAEVAFLLGTQPPGHVSRYEHFGRMPSLPTALAYEALFGTPVRALFEGAYRERKLELLRKVRLLVRKLQSEPTNPVTLRKLKALMAILIVDVG